VKLVYVNDPAQCQQMLSNGRIDFLMMHPDQATLQGQRGHKVVEDNLDLSFNGHEKADGTKKLAADLRGTSQITRSMDQSKNASCAQSSFCRSIDDRMSA
jgi:hypothetical protein